MERPPRVELHQRDVRVAVQRRLACQQRLARIVAAAAPRIGLPMGQRQLGVMLVLERAGFDIVGVAEDGEDLVRKARAQ